MRAKASLFEAVGLGLLASLFFAFTFVLNRQMNLSGGSWTWSASLRFMFMLPMLAALLVSRGGLGRVLREMRHQPAPWLVWGTVGFGLFYAPLCYASTFGPSWLVAATWQLTIVAGALLTPLSHGPRPRERRAAEGAGFGIGGLARGLPIRAILFSLVILAGVGLLQLREAGSGPKRDTFLLILFVMIAAFAYPLGNRKMMRHCDDRLSTIERVFGMTLGSMPFWLALAVFSLASAGPPSRSQLAQTFLVALFSGIVATLLFFKATDLVHGDMHRLAAVESTQSGEVVFSLLGGVFVFGDAIPSALGFAGLALVVTGMLLTSLFHARS
ncbi:MAG TPA: multidrug resistance efflux transporter family protein [Rectinemataceae bacterium]|nr:multidrug resistance efflux transporter family protein [Rectinemataceae bacterium]